jgi:hypothetical protein
MVVKHDYVHQTLTFTPPDEYRYTGSGTVLTIERPRQIPMIRATLDSIPGAFGIDTGARSALLLYGPYCEQNRLAANAMAGLIGPDVLSQFDVTFDYARSRVILEKNANYGRRDSYDRAGARMGQQGSSFTVVDVIAGGPADEAGVRVGDTILAIDGRSTERLSLPDVREQMRRRAVGEKVKLLLESHGKRRTVVATLRDLA